MTNRMSRKASARTHIYQQCDFMALLSSCRGRSSDPKPLQPNIIRHKPKLKCSHRSQVSAVFVFVLLQGTATAQNWSDWITSNNHDVQYRWSASGSGGNGDCHLQLRDQQGKSQTVVSVVIDYQSEQAESTRDVVTICDSQKADDQFPTAVHHCSSISNLHVTYIARR